MLSKEARLLSSFKAQREETREAGGHKARKADAELPTKLNQ